MTNQQCIAATLAWYEERDELALLSLLDYVEEYCGSSIREIAESLYRRIAEDASHVEYTKALRAQPAM